MAHGKSLELRKVERDLLDKSFNDLNTVVVVQKEAKEKIGMVGDRLDSSVDMGSIER